MLILFFFQIVEVEMPYDKQKNQRKGFCFITFESEQIVSELLKTPKQNINGKEVRIDIKVRFQQHIVSLHEIVLRKMKLRSYHKM